jgi:hypothetical protein
MASTSNGLSAKTFHPAASVTSDDIIDLYSHIPIGTKLLVLPTAHHASVAPGIVAAQQR